MDAERAPVGGSAPIVHVAGARPNFPKLAPVMRALDERGIDQLLVHTGQHFDDALSRSFFRDLDLPEPTVDLGAGGGTHAVSTATIMTAVEPVLVAARPSVVVVYGDVNSTVAAALVAAKLGIRVAHVESGLRSRDRSMPEEINRIVTDHVSDLHFVTSADAVDNLRAEGIAGEHVHLVGNPMIDSLLASAHRWDAATAPGRLGVPTHYAVATIHRPSNVDSAEDARAVTAAVHSVADLVDVVVPLHPRGRAHLEAAGLADHPRVHVRDPLPYIDFMSAVSGARMVVTDSGGIQEETTVLGVPCLTLRENTERPVTITHGTNQLVGRADLAEKARAVLASPPVGVPAPPLWDGHAGERIAEILARLLGDETPASGTATTRHAAADSRVRPARPGERSDVTAGR